MPQNSAHALGHAVGRIIGHTIGNIVRHIPGVQPFLQRVYQDTHSHNTINDSNTADPNYFLIIPEEEYRNMIEENLILTHFQPVGLITERPDHGAIYYTPLIGVIENH